MTGVQTCAIPIYMAVDGQGANKNGNKRADDKPGQPDKSEVSRRFARLLTVDNNVDFREEYNNSAIRGRVQDRNTAVETEPMMMLSFYSSPSELRRNTYYIREVDDLNATRMLRFALVVTNAVPDLDVEGLVGVGLLEFLHQVLQQGLVLLRAPDPQSDGLPGGLSASGGPDRKSVV